MRPGAASISNCSPRCPDAWHDPALGARWAELRDLRRVVTGALEVERAAKRIGSGLQAEVALFVAPRHLAVLREVDLAELCITSGGTVTAGTPPEGAFTLSDVAEIGVVVGPASGARCERCWRVLPEIGQVAGHDDLCPRCAEVIDRGAIAAQDPADRQSARA